jgi:hypothetical protein
MSDNAWLQQFTCRELPHLQECSSETAGRFALKKPDIGQGLQAACFLLCALVGLHVTFGLGETEFGGGWLTGPLLSMADNGVLLFIIAFVGTFFWPRIAAAVGLASTLLCLPLYSFLIAPVPFAQIFARGLQWKGQPTPGFHWETWPVIALFASALAIYVCVRRFAAKGGVRTPQRA